MVFDQLAVSSTRSRESTLIVIKGVKSTGNEPNWRLDRPRSSFIIARSSVIVRKCRRGSRDIAAPLGMSAHPIIGGIA